MYEMNEISEKIGTTHSEEIYLKYIREAIAYIYMCLIAYGQPLWKWIPILMDYDSVLCISHEFMSHYKIFLVTVWLILNSSFSFLWLWEKIVIRETVIRVLKAFKYSPRLKLRDVEPTFLIAWTTQLWERRYFRACLGADGGGKLPATTNIFPLIYNYLSALTVRGGCL